MEWSLIRIESNVSKERYVTIEDKDLVRIVGESTIRGSLQNKHRKTVVGGGVTECGLCVRDVQPRDPHLVLKNRPKTPFFTFLRYLKTGSFKASIYQSVCYKIVCKLLLHQREDKFVEVSFPFLPYIGFSKCFGYIMLLF